VSTREAVKTDKGLLVVCLLSFGNCEYKAFKIVGDTVLIDTCYDKNEKTFRWDKSELVSNNILYSNLNNLTNIQWKQIESDIDKITTCDFAIPCEIVLMENSKIETFSLKRMSGCYPQSTKNIMTALDNYFEKMR
jgi:hypothetical protein